MSKLTTAAHQLQLVALKRLKHSPITHLNIP